VGIGKKGSPGYTDLTQSGRVEEVDPISQHYASSTPAGVTGQTNGTFEYYLDMAGYKYLAVQWDETAGAAGDNTLTVEVAVQDDGTDTDSCTYHDVTNDVYGVANLTADGVLHPTKPLVCKYAKITVVRANDGGNNDGAWTIWAKRLY
jgi:hypothetical protein